MYVSMHTYIHTCMCVYIYIYIYIYRERERDYTHMKETKDSCDFRACPRCAGSSRQRWRRPWIIING